MKQIKLICGSTLDTLEIKTNNIINKLVFEGYEILDIRFKNNKTIGYTMVIYDDNK